MKEYWPHHPPGRQGQHHTVT